MEGIWARRKGTRRDLVDGKGRRESLQRKGGGKAAREGKCEGEVVGEHVGRTRPSGQPLR